MENNFLNNKNYIDLTSYFKNKNLSKEEINIGFDGRIIYNNEEYYLKDIKNLITMYCELIAQNLLDVLGIPHVKYYLAKFYDKAYLLSKTFKKKGNNYISGYKILDDYKTFLQKKYDINDMNNLEMIWNALSYRYNNIYGKEKGNIIVAKLMDELTTIFSFDVVIDNEDRHQSNWLIEEGKDHISLSKVFDNEYMLNSYLDKDSLNSFALGIYYEDTSQFLNYSQMIKNYVRDSATEFIDKLWYIYNKLDYNTFLECLLKVEKEYSLEIEPEIKTLLLTSYQKHHKLIGQILKDYQISHNILH